MAKRKNKRRDSSPVPPETLAMIEEKYGNVLNFSGVPDEAKMSAKVIELIEPFFEYDDQLPTLCDCATIAWNECLREDDGEKGEYSLLNALTDYSRYDGLIDRLKVRKRELFGDDFRRIRQIVITPARDGGMQVNVVSDTDMEKVLSMAIEKLKKLK